MFVWVEPPPPLLQTNTYYPGQKKRTILEIRGEKNAVPRVISCSIRRDQRRAKVADSRGSDLPCADRAWSSMISHVEQRSSRRESRWWFFFLSRVVHYMHMEKCWPTWNAGIVYMMRYTWWCLALRSILGKACDVPGSTEGLFSCFFLSGVGAYRPPFVLHITDSASDVARSWRSRVSSAEDVDKLGLGHEGLHVSEVCNIMGFFVTETTRKPCKTTRSSPKMPIFLPNEQALTLSPLKWTLFVWNKMPVIGDGPLEENSKNCVPVNANVLLFCCEAWRVVVLR